METGRIFDPLPINELERLASSIELAYQPITVVLVDGDLLIGCLAKHWHWNGESLGLGFSTSSGQRYGTSHLVEIPVRLVADLQPFPLSETSTPRLSLDDPASGFFQSLGPEYQKYLRTQVQDYPNPLASMICNHDLPIIERHAFQLLTYLEASLPLDAIPPGGIQFDQDFIMYVDTDFFTQHMSGTLGVNFNVPLVGVSKDLSPSPKAEVINLLKGSPFRTLHTRISPVGLDGRLIQGQITLPDPPLNTDIEGDNCIVVICGPEVDNDSETFLVLLKSSRLKFPLEFLGHIASMLTVFGEPLPFPLEISGSTYHQAILARAIGYLH